VKSFVPSTSPLRPPPPPRPHSPCLPPMSSPRAREEMPTHWISPAPLKIEYAVSDRAAVSAQMGAKRRSSAAPQADEPPRKRSLSSTDRASPGSPGGELTPRRRCCFFLLSGSPNVHRAADHRRRDSGAAGSRDERNGEKRKSSHRASEGSLKHAGDLSDLVGLASSACAGLEVSFTRGARRSRPDGA
jgi:hypothetical protein